jgi:molecular chaperone DnaK
LIQEVRETVAAAAGDPDAAAKCEKRLLELKLQLDEAADAIAWPALVAETRQWIDYLRGAATRNGTQTQQDKAATLEKEADTIIGERMMDRLRKKREQIERLYWEILFAQPGFWVDQFQSLEKDKDKVSDPARAARLLDQGRDYISRNNLTGLQNIVRQFWDLLPREVVEASQRGYQSGLVR